MHKAKTILFDLDGTLFDTRDSIIQGILHTVRTLGAPEPRPEDCLKFVGPPLVETFTGLVGADHAQEALKTYLAYYMDEGGMFQTEPYHGIVDVLGKLKEAGRELFVTTSKAALPSCRILDHFNLTPYFTQIYGSQPDGTRSNKAEVIAAAMHEHSLSPDNTVMIGDRLHDVIGAKKNNLRVIGAAWGYGSLAELRENGATAIAPRPEDLLNLLLAA